jgi:hypothetical protein
MTIEHTSFMSEVKEDNTRTSPRRAPSQTAAKQPTANDA